MSLVTETAKAKENKDNIKKVKTDTDSVLTELGGESSSSLSDIPNKIRALAANLVDKAKEYVDGKIGDLSSLQTTKKDTVVNSINEVNRNKANKSIKHKVVLSKDSWTGAEAPYSYEITISGMDENKNWEVTNSVDPIMTVEELDAFCNARIIAGTQSANKINLIAYGEKPSIDINILVLVRGD